MQQGAANDLQQQAQHHKAACERLVTTHEDALRENKHQYDILKTKFLSRCALQYDRAGSRLLHKACDSHAGLSTFQRCFNGIYSSCSPSCSFCCTLDCPPRPTEAPAMMRHRLSHVVHMVMHKPAADAVLVASCFCCRSAGNLDQMTLRKLQTFEGLSKSKQQQMQQLRMTCSR